MSFKSIFIQTASLLCIAFPAIAMNKPEISSTPFSKTVMVTLTGIDTHMA